jgi:UDP-N-acetyl-D-galactosamine dehydrogenase
LRNTRVIDIVRELTDYGLNVQVSDPLVDSEEAQREYEVTLIPFEKLDSADCVVLAVAHSQYVQAGWGLATQLLPGGEGVVFDIQGVLPRESKPESVSLWRL